MAAPKIIIYTNHNCPCALTSLLSLTQPKGNEH